MFNHSPMDIPSVITILIFFIALLILILGGRND